MSKFTVGDLVRIFDSGFLYTHYTGWFKGNIPLSWVAHRSKVKDEVFLITDVRPHTERYTDCDLAYVVGQTSGEGYVVGVQGLTLETPSPVTQVKPKASRLGSTNRQFDVTFKQGIVRACDLLKRTKQHGQITVLLKQHGIGSNHLWYWRQQMAQGHFSSERAVAFSRKDTMIHG